MNWLERHYREFVFPVIVGRRFGTRVDDLDISATLEPYTKVIRPAKGCSSPELGMLKAVLSNCEMRGFTQSALFSNFAFRGITMDGNDSHSSVLAPGNLVKFTPEALIHNMIKNSVRELKSKLNPGNKAVLLGRDVWLFAVMCEKMGVPYVYEPVVSRDVCRHFEALSSVVSRLNLRSGDVLFDTGFQGSIYQAVDEITPVAIHCLMLSANENEFQQFPHNKLSRNRALFIEYLPKYFSTGRVTGFRFAERHDGKVEPAELVAVQPFSSAEQFINCALLTGWLWDYQSPRWVPGPAIKLKGGKRVPTKLAVSPEMMTHL